MTKHWISVLSLTLNILATAQSSEPFKGGSGDGNNRQQYVQGTVSFWNGAAGDGTAMGLYTQPSNDVWIGGNAGGFAKGAFLQSSTAFWQGGDGDGFAKTGYTQASIGFWLGGQGDGHADTGYSQQSQAFWLGGAGDGWASTYIPNRALPVTLTSFTVIKKSPAEALLNWTTKTETNSSHFDIERSSDAVHFYFIQKVNAAGNSLLPKDYAFTDNKVIAGNNYYRLKQVDKDGRFVYTPTRLVTFNVETTGQLKIYPNPANAYVSIEWPGSAATEKTIVNIMDMKGNVVKQWKMVTDLRAPSRLSVQGLAKGTYIVHVINGQHNTLQKLIIQ